MLTMKGICVNGGACMYVGMCVLSLSHTHTHAVHEEDQAQELAVDAARGRHERRQESHVPVAAICVTIIADLVGSGALEDVVRVVGVAELALMLPYLTSADEIVAQGDVHQQIGVPRGVCGFRDRRGGCSQLVSHSRAPACGRWRNQCRYKCAPTPARHGRAGAQVQLEA